MDISKFNLWRATFSFCFVDGFLAKEEELWIKEKLGFLKFSEEQKKILMNDLVSPPEIDEILPLITRASDKGFLVNHLRVLAQIDGDISPVEKMRINDVKNKVLSKIDLVALDKQIEENERESYHEDEVYKVQWL